jgi:hypothetical protein
MDNDPHSLSDGGRLFFMHLACALSPMHNKQSGKGGLCSRGLRNSRALASPTSNIAKSNTSKLPPQLPHYSFTARLLIQGNSIWYSRRPCGKLHIPELAQRLIQLNCAGAIPRNVIAFDRPSFSYLPHVALLHCHSQIIGQVLILVDRDCLFSLRRTKVHRRSLGCHNEARHHRNDF